MPWLKEKARRRLPCGSFKTIKVSTLPLRMHVAVFQKIYCRASSSRFTQLKKRARVRARVIRWWRPNHDHSSECELIMIIGRRRTISIKVLIVDDEELDLLDLLRWVK
jgi:hypothetical protein